jgi:hypothetical protein
MRFFWLAPSGFNVLEGLKGNYDVRFSKSVAVIKLHAGSETEIPDLQVSLLTRAGHQDSAKGGKISREAGS